MEMRLVCAAVVLVGFMAASAAAGEKAQPVSKSTLASMGLGQMKPMEDAEGAQVRGKFTFAWVKGMSQVGGTMKSYSQMNTHFASGFKLVFSGGGVAGGGAFSFSQ